METYERKKASFPPGAKEKDAGKINHSVNLRLGRPSSAGYACGLNDDGDGNTSQTKEPKEKIHSPSA